MWNNQSYLLQQSPQAAKPKGSVDLRHNTNKETSADSNFNQAGIKAHYRITRKFENRLSQKINNDELVGASGNISILQKNKRSVICKLPLILHST
jgi:hypothetical protein